MKSPYEIEHERIVIGFIIAILILVVIALVFNKELILCLVTLRTKLLSLVS